MEDSDEINRSTSIKTEEEYRKIAYMFPEYLFLDNDYSIIVAGRSIEELLNYNYGFLRNKCINTLTDRDDLKSSLMIQITEHFFEWRSFSLKASNSSPVDVEICGFRINHSERIGNIAIRVRKSRNHLEHSPCVEVEKLTYWIAHNLRGPLATIEGLINLAKISKNNLDTGMYLNYMSQQALRLDEKIQLVIRLGGRIVK
jgi:nitrogen-specific signal transduction histidine kinase